jgi:hypothetical protein
LDSPCLPQTLHHRRIAGKFQRELEKKLSSVQ